MKQLAAAVGMMAFALAAVTGAAHPAPAAMPSSFVLLLNGKPAPLTSEIGGSDEYHPIRSGPLTVEARWKGNTRGSGYFVQILTSEPKVHVYARCFTGTRCTVAKKVPIVLKGEMSWNVEVVTAKSHIVVNGFKSCLVGT
jgi:hypothetical protein